MAENESLDLGNRRSQRWRHLCDRIGEGAGPAEAAELTRDCLIKVLGNIIRPNSLTGKPQFELGRLLAALGGKASELRELVAQCDNHDYAVSLAEERGKAPVPALEGMMTRATDGFLDQAELSLVGQGRFASASDFQIFRAQLRTHLVAKIRDLATKVAAEPTKPPRLSPMPAAHRELSRTSLMTESLLGRRAGRPQ